MKESSIPLENLSKESWIISTPQEFKIRKRIEEIGTPLKNWDINIYRGVLTGYNKAFIISGKKKDELIEQDPKSAEIIKPILRGRDVKRYKAEFADKWLIATHNGYTHKFPSDRGVSRSDGVFNSPLKRGADEVGGEFDLSNQNYPHESEKTFNALFSKLSEGIFKKYKKLPYNPKLKERAKKLRKAGILSEVLFWNQVEIDGRFLIETRLF